MRVIPRRTGRFAAQNAPLEGQSGGEGPGRQGGREGHQGQVVGFIWVLLGFIWFIGNVFM